MSKLVSVIVRGDVKCSGSEIVARATSCTSIFNQMDWVDPADLWYGAGPERRWAKREDVRLIAEQFSGVGSEHNCDLFGRFAQVLFHSSDVGGAYYGAVG